MQKIVMEGGQPLAGDVLISGAKNSALPLLFATLLSQDNVHLHNIPTLRDINTTLSLMESLGARITRPEKKNLPYIIEAHSLKHLEAPYDLVKTMRASVLVMGPLLAKYGKARVSLPGGCAIGARPINLHLKAFEQMGAKIHIEGGYVEAEAKKLHGARIYFDTVTVTGTENVLMAAVLAKGETILENAAREPEVVDLANLLIKMGAKIQGAGTDTITIEGVESLSGAIHTVIADRIEMGTFMIAAGMTAGNIFIKNGDFTLLEALRVKLEEVGVQMTEETKGTEKGIRVIGPKHLKSADITTSPFPGFATDFQAQFMAMMTVAQGSSVITETIFENRFMHAQELMRMGADIKIEGKAAIVKGVKKLSGAPVMASDLRASAALILAGLVADGLTEVHRIYHLDRGYEAMEKKFRKLGARIKRAQVKY